MLAALMAADHAIERSNKKATGGALRAPLF